MNDVLNCCFLFIEKYLLLVKRLYIVGVEGWKSDGIEYFDYLVVVLYVVKGNNWSLFGLLINWVEFWSRFVLEMNNIGWGFIIV